MISVNKKILCKPAKVNNTLNRTATNGFIGPQNQNKKTVRLEVVVDAELEGKIIKKGSFVHVLDDHYSKNPAVCTQIEVEGMENFVAVDYSFVFMVE